MYSFVILGQIPGTGITISFTMWAAFAGLLIVGATLYKRADKQKPVTQSSNVMVIRNGQPVPANEITL